MTRKVKRALLEAEFAIKRLERDASDIAKLVIEITGKEKNLKKERNERV